MNLNSWKKRGGVYVPDGFKPAARASFDSSQSGPQMAKRFAYADNLSADQDNSDATRTTVRNRARYEAQNSTYARGITLTVANDMIGTGPRLQFLSRDEGLNRRIEAAFSRWAKEIRLAEKLRTMRLARMIDGEVFAQM